MRPRWCRRCGAPRWRLFAFCLFVGQAIGVTLAGYAFDHLGHGPLLLAPALALPLAGWGFARALRTSRGE